MFGVKNEHCPIKDLIMSEYTIVNVVKDALTGNLKFVSKQTSSYRMFICQGCPAYNPKWKKCTVCGCFMPLKTKLVKASCPMENWGALDGEEIKRVGDEL